MTTSLRMHGLLLLASACMLVLFVVLRTPLSSNIVPGGSFTLRLTTTTNAQLQLEPVTKTGAFLLTITNTGEYPTSLEFTTEANILSWLQTSRTAATLTGSTVAMQQYVLAPQTGLQLYVRNSVDTLKIRNINTVPILLPYIWVDLRTNKTMQDSIASTDALIPIILTQ